LRKLHEGELDFRTEAANLAACAANLEKHGFTAGASKVAVIPRVPASAVSLGLVSRHVLAMEYLEGRSLASVVSRLYRLSVLRRTSQCSSFAVFSARFVA